MTDKKKIKKMASDLSKEVIQDYGGVYYLETAEGLYNLGYRKIPEGSVVVSRQVWEEHIEKREKANKIFEERIRKETAKKILNELYEQIDEKTPKWVETQIKIKAKQFGVEVEE